MLRLLTFRRIVHCRREANMAAVWDQTIVFYSCFMPVIFFTLFVPTSNISVYISEWKTYTCISLFLSVFASVCHFLFHLCFRDLNQEPLPPLLLLLLCLLRPLVPHHKHQAYAVAAHLLMLALWVSLVVPGLLTDHKDFLGQSSPQLHQNHTVPTLALWWCRLVVLQDHCPVNQQQGTVAAFITGRQHQHQLNYEIRRCRVRIHSIMSIPDEAADKLLLNTALPCSVHLLHLLTQVPHTLTAAPRTTANDEQWR